MRWGQSPLLVSLVWAGHPSRRELRREEGCVMRYIVVEPLISSFHENDVILHR